MAAHSMPGEELLPALPALLIGSIPIISTTWKTPGSLLIRLLLIVPCGLRLPLNPIRAYVYSSYLLIRPQ